MTNKRLEIGPDTQFAWALANAEACFAGDKLIHPPHFLLAILAIIDNAFHQDADNMGLPAEGIEALLAIGEEIHQTLNQAPDAVTHARKQLRESLRKDRTPEPLHMLHRSETSRLLFKGATKRAIFYHSHTLGLSHLWNELLSTQTNEILTYFPDFDIYSIKSIYSSLGTSQEARWQVVDDHQARHPSSNTPVMDEIGRDLTDLARKNKLPSVVGRLEEMRATARFLMRTSKRGVMLVGDAGIGKTAIVEGLAQRIVSSDAPKAIRSFRIIQINVVDLISGTKYRGDMEQKLQALINEAENDPNIILFIDESHLLMQAGTGTGPMDIANILKPALGRDAIRCIGATTTDEFERYIRPDAAFMRRFQVVRVSEPSIEQANLIASSWAQRIQKLQQVEFNAEAVKRAVELADEFITDRFLPDSAIDLLENAAAYSQVSSLTQHHTTLTKKARRITRELVEQVLEEVHGFSAKREALCDPALILEQLQKDIIGQQHAIGSIAETLATLQLPDHRRDKPLAVLLFTGPTGVGKTYTAGRLAQALFGAETSAFFQVNMGEFKERHELARITGAPPGFIGHEQEPALFRFVRANPQGLILLDEMEKSHPEIQDFFLQIFDRGVACDSHGRPAYFRNMVFVMSCNVTSGPKTRPIGFIDASANAPEEDNKIKSALLEHFRPEFLGRIDGIIPFLNLALADLEILLHRQFYAFASGIKEDYEVNIKLDEAYSHTICETFASTGDGIRGFLRKIERELFIPALRAVKKAKHNETINISFDGAAITVHAAHGLLNSPALSGSVYPVEKRHTNKEVD